MEKFVDSPPQPSPNSYRAALVDLEPVEIKRGMKLFGSAIGLAPGQRAVPSADVFVRLTSDHTGHQALLRAELGEHYKNFENLRRGRGTRSTTTLASIEARLKPKFDLPIHPTVGVSKTEPLWPELLDAVQHFIDMPFRLFLSMMGHGPTCQDCGVNKLEDAEVWWASEAGGLKLEPPEYRFAERLIVATLASTIHELFAWVEGEPGTAIHSAIALAAPGQHPFGNWLRQVKQARRVDTYQQLAMARVVTWRNSVVDEARLAHWACGEYLLPIAVGEQLTEGLSNARRLRRRLTTSRLLALVIEFLGASAAGSTPTREEVQRVVVARMEKLRLNLLQAVAAHQQRTLQADG